MPSPIVHLAAGYAVYRVATRGPQDRRPDPVLLTAVLVLSLLPDFDAGLGILLGDFGRYHNSQSHSLFVGLAVAAATVPLFTMAGSRRVGRWFVLVLVCYELHIVLDYFTWGRGVMALWPFTADRLTAPLWLFYGLHWSQGFVSPRHLVTLATEIPVAAVLVAAARRATRALRRAEG